MGRKDIFAIGEYYHLYNRGIDKRTIFNNDTDRFRFLKLLYLCNGDKSFHFSDLSKDKEYEFNRGEKLVEISAYCLMDNHFHLLVREIKDKGISTFMHKLGVAYSMYFNKINERRGSLFEYIFNSKHVDNDEYLKYLFAYIHLNPIKILEPGWKEGGIRDIQKAKVFLNDYYFSSYLDYLGIDRNENTILDRGSLPEYFLTRVEIEDYINDWLAFSPRD